MSTVFKKENLIEATMGCEYLILRTNGFFQEFLLNENTFFC